ncbi:MAG TPA: hypothetical protein VHV83_19090 [Armatimonadota bacterium]|nr:hypothetical protein [Armatimonadota bacterium]
MPLAHPYDGAPWASCQRNAKQGSTHAAQTWVRTLAKSPGVAPGYTS